MVMHVSICISFCALGVGKSSVAATLSMALSLLCGDGKVCTNHHPFALRRGGRPLSQRMVKFT